MVGLMKTPKAPKPLTFEQVRYWISADGAIKASQRATPKQLDYLAHLIVEVQANWTPGVRRGYRVWEASSAIRTMEEYKRAGGYAAWLKTKLELERMELLEDEGRFCFLKGGNPRMPNYGGPESYRDS
jgi:hypothetical protein